MAAARTAQRLRASGIAFQRAAASLVSRPSLPLGAADKGRSLLQAWLPSCKRGVQASSGMSSAAISLTSEAELADYRLNVGICVVNKQGRVFAARRKGNAGKPWQLPQGGIDPGENALTAAIRELQEETSITSVRVVGQIDRSDCVNGGHVCPRAQQLA